MNNNLFQDFQPSTTQEWVEIIKKDLKGADLKKLMRKTIDGLSFQPFYRKESTENLPTVDTQPNKFPFLRGYKLNNDWTIRQDFLFENVDLSSQKASNSVKKGVKLVGFDFGKSFDLSVEELKSLSKNIENVAFSSFENVENAYYLIKENNLKFQSVFLNFDPITLLAFTGGFNKEEQKTWTIASDLLSNEIKNIKPIGINLHHYANAGATPVMQLAFGLATIAEYFDLATELKIPLEKVLPNISVNLGVGCEYFMEVSKIRAFRYLYSKLVEAYDVNLKDKAKTHINGITLRRNKTIYDAHINMLRTTVETLAGVVGGVDSFSVDPFDTVFAKPNEFSERIAVNQQFVIKEEAYADKVTDPAGGSYYVENLTVKLIEEAWNLFLKIQDNGGFCDSLRSNFIFDLVDEIVQKENNLVDTGRISILGTNKYPNITENQKNTQIKKPFEISDIFYKNVDFKTLKTSRLSERFEELRQKTEKSDKTPEVFLFTYGNVAMRRARADFSANFFAVAGFKVTDNVGFDKIEQGIEATQKTNSDIIVLCSDDNSYLELADKIKSSFPEKIIVIAGNPVNKNEIEKVGISNFIHVKSNIYSELVEYQKLLNI